MKSLKDIKTYLPFTLNTFQKNLSYRANVIMFIIGDAVMLSVSYYLWKAIYASSTQPIINGFTFNEMVIYILISFLTGLLISVDISYRISSEVKDGSIAINLIRPINYEKRMLFEALGDVLYNFTIVFIIGITGVTILLYNYSMSLSIGQTLAYILSLVMSILLNFYYSYTFGLLSFKLTNMWGVSQIMGAITQLLSGMLIPIVFFPTWVQGLFNFLPFSSMIYTPTMIYLGKLNGKELYSALFIQFIWVCILSFIAKVMWKKLIKHLVILGG